MFVIIAEARNEVLLPKIRKENHAVADSNVAVVVHTKTSPEAVLSHLTNEIAIAMANTFPSLGISTAKDIFVSAIIFPAQQ